MTNKPYKTLYKLNTNGSIQEWSICFDDKSHWSVSGKVGGKMIIASPTMVTAKVNRTLEEQILSEVESAIKKKRDKKYVDNIEDVNSAEDALDGYSAQLAHSFEKQSKKIKYPCAAQPKLDGIRCLSTIDGMFSRGHKQFSSCSHIQAELEDFFKGNPEARLDGEFYTHEYKNDFEKICKAVKKTAEKATQQDIELQKKIEYHVYDAPRIDGLTEKDSFKDRQTALAKKLANYKYIKVVKTNYDITNETRLKMLKEKWVQDGYEGLMVRNIDSPYEGKRSYNLQKLKDFQDKEFIIVRVNEGNGKLKGHAGSFTFCLHNNEADRFLASLDDNNVDTFDAKMRGSTENLKDLFENTDKCIGKLATVRFQNLTDAGVPRFPVCIGIRDYE